MSYIHIKSPIVSILTVFVFLIYCFPTSSAVKIKGGVITSAEILKTQKPKPRNDLILDLNNIDKTHLEQKLTLEEAIRFENRIGIGAPYDRVKRYIGKTRKEAINLVINELENYQDNFEWPNWKDNYIPTSFIEQGLERSKRSCRISSFRTDLEFKWSRAILSNKVPQFEKLALLWLDHFSVAFDEYNQTHSFVQHLEFIRKNAIGKFDDFLRQSIMDPAIIVYLNNEQSTTQKPNENEILQNSDNFKEDIVSRSFFEDKKLIIISRASDKIFKIIEEIINKDIDCQITLHENMVSKKIIKVGKVNSAVDSPNHIALKALPLRLLKYLDIVVDAVCDINP